MMLIHLQQFLEGAPHLVPVSERKVAQNQVEARAEIGFLVHDVLERSDGIVVQALLYAHHPNVLLNLHSVT
jgi:hypothetical protein